MKTKAHDNKMKVLAEKWNRQDFVDNHCHSLLEALAGRELAWNIELIGQIRDAAEDVITVHLNLMTPKEFYP
jgi:hypothetical protein